MKITTRMLMLILILILILIIGGLIFNSFSDEYIKGYFDNTPNNHNVPDSIFDNVANGTFDKK